MRARFLVGQTRTSTSSVDGLGADSRRQRRMATHLRRHLDLPGILTGAHCVVDSSKDDLPLFGGGHFRAIVGKDVGDWDESSALARWVTRSSIATTRRRSDPTLPALGRRRCFDPAEDTCLRRPGRPLLFGEMPSGTAMTTVGWGSVAPDPDDSKQPDQLQKLDNYRTKPDSECAQGDGTFSNAAVAADEYVRSKTATGSRSAVPGTGTPAALPCCGSTANGCRWGWPATSHVRVLTRTTSAGRPSSISGLGSPRLWMPEETPREPTSRPT